jgi:hypothetical protein
MPPATEKEHLLQLARELQSKQDLQRWAAEKAAAAAAAAAATPPAADTDGVS